MRMLSGEVRQVGIQIANQDGTNFVISSADYTIYDSSEAIVAHGSSTIDGYKILTLFSATVTGAFVCEFTYRIGAEILKARISINVNTM